MAHTHHSHAADISAAERDRISAFCQAEQARGPDWCARAEQVLGELAFFAAGTKSKAGLWSMGELDRFVSEYLPSHLGDASAAKAAPDIIIAFAHHLKATDVPACDVAAVEKRMKKVTAR